MHQLWQALWFFLPAGLANSAPVFASLLPGLRHLNFPLDFGKTHRGKRIFGDHKTIRGVVAGIIMATIIIGLQKYAFSHTEWARSISYFDYSTAVVWWLGPLLGLGALLGDAIESYFKRRAHLQPGQPWFPFDQIDYILGGLLFSLPIVRLYVWNYLVILVVWFGVHVIATNFGYLIRLKERPI